MDMINDETQQLVHNNLSESGFLILQVATPQ